jgi:Protein of unknown function (DUF4087)
MDGDTFMRKQLLLMQKQLLIAVGLVISIATPGLATETRCGWLDNPTPGNWWLTDADARWTLGVQGGYQAPGMENIPDMSRGQYVETNGSYGYACACMEVSIDAEKNRISRIYSVEQLNLKQCRQDPNLPQRPK